MKKIMIIIAAMALIAAANTAYAQRWGRGMGPGMMGGQGYGQGYNQNYGYGQDDAARGDYGYGLSEEQSKQYREIYNKYAPEIFDLRSKLTAKTEQLNALRWKRDPDQGKVDSLINDINDLRSKMFTKMEQMRSELLKNDLPPNLNCPGDGPCSAPRYGRGYGYGMGPWMGRPGYYDNMGPGMMGPGGYGHMGPGMMYGPGHMRGYQGW